ncbi:S8 family serine peptidase [Flavisolibacter sp. BT320]|nr:S8 family serine peptidase [Flavisolibacter longurius]
MTIHPIRCQTAVLILCLLLFVAATCKKSTTVGQRKPTPFRPNELVIVYPSGLTQDKRESIRKSLLARYQISKVETCICDPSIERIIAENVDQAITTDTSSRPASTSSRIGVQGVDLVLSKNVLFQQPMGQRTRRLVPFNFNKIRGNLRIAVIDTGIDTTDNQHFTGASFSNFLLPSTAANYSAVGITDPNRINRSRYFGWNFMTNNQNIKDDHARQHGTVVTGLLLSQITETAPSIIYLKAFDASGSSDMFTIRCALKFAEKAGAQIINASWGYDDAEENEALRAAISSLERNNILLVAAAGNNGYNTNTVPHWPGSFSNTSNRGFSNVITVATATMKGICLPNSNYSGERVDVAVSGRGDNCSFADVFDGTGQLRETGTSYATAIMTGVIANQFANQSFDRPLKNTVLDRVLHNLPIIPTLSGKIRTQKRIVQ